MQQFSGVSDRAPKRQYRRKAMKQLIAILTCLGCLAGAVYSDDEPTDLFGRFLHVKGKVEMVKKGEVERAPVKRGDLIRFGDKVWTGENSQATIITSGKKIINLVGNRELDTTADQPEGKMAPSLHMEGLFEESFSEDTLVAVAGIRVEMEYILSPRNSAVKSETPVIRLAALPPDHSCRIQITGGGLPSPYKGTIKTNVLDLSKVQLRKPLKRDQTYFIQVEVVDAQGKLRGKERDIFMHIISEEDYEKISAIEKEIAQFQKEDPENPSYPLILALESEDLSLYSDALDIYEELHTKFPDDPFIERQLAHIYNQTKRITDLKKLTVEEEEEK